MAKKALYLGCEHGELASPWPRSAAGDPIDVFATTTLDDALQELIRTDFEWLIVDRPADETAVQLLLGTAKMTSTSPPTVLIRSEYVEVSDQISHLVSDTFSSLDEIILEPRNVAGERTNSSHPILSTLKRQEGTRVLAHIDRDGTYLWSNTRLASLVERTPEELIGRTVEEIPPPAIADDDFMMVVQTTVESQELNWIGTESLGLYCLFPIDDQSVLLFSHSTNGSVAFGERYLDQISDLFFVVDFEGGLYYWNDRVNEVTGYSDVELLDTNVFDLFPPDAREHAREKMQAVALYGEQTVEVPIVTKDGGSAPHQVSGSLITGSDGTPQFVCGIGRDISKRVAMRQEIEKAVEKLEESNAELERFASVASHDLREPLRAVRSYLELLDRRYADELDQDAREFIQFAVEGAERMQSMIQNLLEYSRIGSRIRREQIDCEEVLMEARDNLAVSIEESDAVIRTENLPVVFGDRTMLVQLFQNLIDNAIQHSGDEPPRIQLRADRANGMWHFTIRDNGPGISEDELDDIFEMFSTGTDGGGLGIGLATCRKIVETHGGNIDVESEPGAGSTFHFTLPAQDQQQ